MKMKNKTLDIIVEVVDEWVCSEDVACMIRMIMKRETTKEQNMNMILMSTLVEPLAMSDIN